VCINYDGCISNIKVTMSEYYLRQILYNVIKIYIKASCKGGKVNVIVKDRNSE